jgi:hypothetical protein
VAIGALLGVLEYIETNVFTRDECRWGTRRKEGGRDAVGCELYQFSHGWFDSAQCSRIFLLFGFLSPPGACIQLAAFS